MAKLGNLNIRNKPRGANPMARSLDREAFDASKMIRAGEMFGVEMLGDEYVNVFDIREHPDNREVNPELVDKLVDSIRERGVLQYPIVRRKPGKGPDGRECRYEHLAGWHRILASRRLVETAGSPELRQRYTNVKCIIVECDDDVAIDVVLESNISSDSLDRVELGKVYRSIAADIDQEREGNGKLAGKRTSEIIAERYGVSPSTVKRCMSQYDKAVGEGSETGVLSSGKVIASAAQRGDGDPAPKKEPAAKKSKGVRCVDKLEKAVVELEGLVEAGEELPVYRLEQLAPRVRAALRDAIASGDGDEDE